MSRNVLVTKFLNAIILYCHCWKIVRNNHIQYKKLQPFCSPWQVKNSNKSHQLATNRFEKKKKIYIYIYIYIHTHTPILKNIAIWKKIYEMCINNRFIYFMYILKFQCVLKTDVYTQYIFFVDHVGITCNSRCIPGEFHLNKLVIDYNQYL